MNRGQLFTLFERARQLSGHDDFVVIGSLSVLGLEDGGPIPDEMSMSIDVDCYTRADPDRVFDLAAPLGEYSTFHVEHGYYLLGNTAEDANAANASEPLGVLPTVIGVDDVLGVLTDAAKLA